MALTYLDIVLVLVAAVPALALGAPAVGYGVAAAVYILQRLVSVEADRRLADMTDYRRRIGLGVAIAMTRVWVLAATIMIVGVTVARADGLTAALVIFGAFSAELRPLGHLAHDADQEGRVMSMRRKIGLSIGAVYFLGFVVIIAIFGATRLDNAEFKPQDEFKLLTWLDLPGPLDINKGVLYLFLATTLTIGVMVVRLQAHAGAARTACRPRSSGPTRGCATRSSATT